MSMTRITINVKRISTVVKYNQLKSDLENPLETGPRSLINMWKVIIIVYSSKFLQVPSKTCVRAVVPVHDLLK